MRYILYRLLYRAHLSGPVKKDYILFVHALTSLYIAFITIITYKLYCDDVVTKLFTHAYGHSVFHIHHFNTLIQIDWHHPVAQGCGGIQV